MNILKTSTFIALVAIGVSANSKNIIPASPETHRPQLVELKTKQLSQREADRLVARVYEIRSMDLNALNKAERSTLRKELVSIKEQLSHPAGGVYISVGGLILLILLLIILF
jgi:hypothetical protein